MYDSSALISLFKKEDIQIAKSIEEADFFILNSCSVTAKADAEARQKLRQAKSKNPELQTILTGCYAMNLKRAGEHLSIYDHLCEYNPPL